METITCKENTKLFSTSQNLIFVLGVSVAVYISWLIRIPFYPVPFTMQTFMVMLLSATCQNKAKLISSGIGIFFIGRIIFSVLSISTINAHLTIGYLIAFCYAPYIFHGCDTNKLPSILSRAILFSVCHLTLGTLWLAIFTKPYTAFLTGFLFFVPAEIFKISLLASALKIKNRFFAKK